MRLRPVADVIEYVPAFTLLMTPPEALRSEIVFFGPTVASSLRTLAGGTGTGSGGGVPETNVRRIPSPTCGSHWSV